MSLSFNTNGNLHKNVSLSFQEFVQYFGTNPSRRKKIDNALTYFKIFGSCDCLYVYVGGSFVTNKHYPEDIDLCFDFSETRPSKLNRDYPELSDPNVLGEIRRNEGCHIWHCTKEYTTLFDALQYDRQGYFKGLVKLSLKDIGKL